MNPKIFVCALLVFLAIACDKNTFNTKPSLKLISNSSKIIPVNGGLSLQFEFTDKEGDISDTLFFRRIRTNKRTTTVKPDSLRFAIPKVSTLRKGIIEVDLTYQNYLVAALQPPLVGSPPKAESDSITLKFALRDKAKNISDTITIENIVVIR